MKNNIYILLAFLGMIGFFSSCEKEGDKVEMLKNPIAPEIVTFPNLSLERGKATEVLKFELSPVKTGFDASAQYFLEVSSSEDFETSELIQSDVAGESMEITVSELNQKLLNIFKEDATSDAFFRLRSVLVVDGGQGAVGTGDKIFEYTSTVKKEAVTIFGLLRLDLNGTSIPLKIVSPLSDGVYLGFAKLDPTKPFTLTDPETSKVYGGSAGKLEVGGAGIEVDPAGWYILTADIANMTYKVEDYMIGIIGSATPTGWGSDTDMDYDAATGRWYITMDLVDGEIKFRKNDGWAWNMGIPKGTESELSGSLDQGGDNIAIVAGNYTVYFTIASDTAGSYELVKNDNN